MFFHYYWSMKCWYLTVISFWVLGSYKNMPNVNVPSQKLQTLFLILFQLQLWNMNLMTFHYQHVQWSQKKLLKCINKEHHSWLIPRLAGESALWQHYSHGQKFRTVSSSWCGLYSVHFYPTESAHLGCEAVRKLSESKMPKILFYKSLNDLSTADFYKERKRKNLDSARSKESFQKELVRKR